MFIVFESVDCYHISLYVVACVLCKGYVLVLSSLDVIVSMATSMFSTMLQLRLGGAACRVSDG
jgi:hypothetical protein